MKIPLTIEFTFMFLVIDYGQDKGVIVLLPSKDHTCELEVIKNSAPLIKHQLRGYQMDIVEKGNKAKTLWGQTVKVERASRLADMRAIFDRNRVSVMRRHVQKPVDPLAINLRVVLGGGTLRDEDTSIGGFKDTPWHFGKPDGGFHQQTLTDRLTYETKLEKESLILFSGRCGVKPVELLNGNSYTVRIKNLDPSVDKRAAGQATREEDYELTEYHTIYDLLDVGARPSGPFGHGPGGYRRLVAGVVNVDDPICGGAQGDPPDPPEDPPTPRPLIGE